MKKEINPVLQRLSDFAESKGGFAEVGRKIQKHPSMFYNLIRRDALPSLATLTEIAEAFPELDLNYVIRGTQSMIDKQLADVQNELEREKLIVSKLLGKRKGASSHPQVDREGYSELLLKGIRKNMKTNNILLLSSSWKLTSPN